MFFEVRTKRLTVTERNAYKTVKELWLFQVESYTEAEARVTEFMNKQFKGEDFSIPKIQPSKIQRVEKRKRVTQPTRSTKLRLNFSARTTRVKW